MAAAAAAAAVQRHREQTAANPSPRPAHLGTLHCRHLRRAAAAAPGPAEPPAARDSSRGNSRGNTGAGKPITPMAGFSLGEKAAGAQAGVVLFAGFLAPAGRNSSSSCSCSSSRSLVTGPQPHLFQVEHRGVEEEKRQKVDGPRGRVRHGHRLKVPERDAWGRGIGPVGRTQARGSAARAPRGRRQKEEGSGARCRCAPPPPPPLPAPPASPAWAWAMK